MGHHTTEELIPLNVAVLTVSDTRTQETDTSGHFLVDALDDFGHKIADKKIVIDDIYDIRATVSQWIADTDVNAIIITGGTGFTHRDSTPEAVIPLFDKEVEGFGELFRRLSYDNIGASTIQSRALAGLANRTVVFCLPGSTGACKDGWGIISKQLDSRMGPCNFVPHLVEDFHQR